MCYTFRDRLQGVPASVLASSGTSDAILQLQLSPSTGRALTTETQPTEPEIAACRRSGISNVSQLPGARLVLGELLNWSIKKGPPPWEHADQSGCRMVSRGRVASGGLPTASAWGACERGSLVAASASFVASRLGVASGRFCRAG